MKDSYQKVLESAETPGGASAEAITKAEQDLGVVFPRSYREFLEKFGAAMGVGYESDIKLRGVFVSNDDGTPMWRNIVTVTNQRRRRAGSDFPKTLLPISSDGVSVTMIVAPHLSEEDEEFPKGFYLRRKEGILWLRGYWSGLDHIYSPEDRVVFERGSCDASGP